MCVCEVEGCAPPRQFCGHKPSRTIPRDVIRVGLYAQPRPPEFLLERQRVGEEDRVVRRELHKKTSPRRGAESKDFGDSAVLPELRCPALLDFQVAGGAVVDVDGHPTGARTAKQSSAGGRLDVVEPGQGTAARGG